MSCCEAPEGKIVKFGADECFSCLGNSIALVIENGHVYPSCSPLVQGDTKNDPLRPMSAPDECIVAWVGPKCSIDTTEWTEPCATHVYPKAVVYKDRACWPADEAGNSLFTIEDVELICQGHPCMFDHLQSCQEARAWLKEVDSANLGK